MADWAHAECLRDTALPPLHARRGRPTSRPVCLPRRQPKARSGHADPSFPVRKPSHPSRGLSSSSVYVYSYRYELPGTAVLRDYKYGIHKFTNMKV